MINICTPFREFTFQVLISELSVSKWVLKASIVVVKHTWFSPRLFSILNDQLKLFIFVKFNRSLRRSFCEEKLNSSRTAPSISDTNCRRTFTIVNQFTLFWISFVSCSFFLRNTRYNVSECTHFSRSNSKLICNHPPLVFSVSSIPLSVFCIPSSSQHILPQTAPCIRTDQH